MTDTSKTVEQVGELIGRAIARDVKADQLPTAWTGIDPQDADQIPEGMDRDAVEVVAERVYRAEVGE